MVTEASCWWCELQEFLWRQMEKGALSEICDPLFQIDCLSGFSKIRVKWTSKGFLHDSGSVDHEDGNGT